MQKRQSVLFLLIAFLFILVSPNKSSAEIVDLTGGIKNEYTYEEYVFISGQPMKFTAKSKDVKVTLSEKKDKITETYKIKMTSTNGATLDRTFAYAYDVNNYETIGQSTATGEVTKYSEKIKYQDNTTIELKDYQMSKSYITDKRPASDYSSGNAIIRKTYEIKDKNGQTQTVVVSGSGQDASYENFWGAAETQIMEYVLEYQNGTVGTVTSRVNYSKSRTLNYEENLGSLASFNGGYAVNSEADTISEYVYELPTGSGEIEFNSQYMPKVERLIVPKFRDLSAHWAKPSIEKLYSLGIFDDQSNFFSPNTAMKRYDFAVAIGKAIDLRVQVGETKKKNNTTPTIFKDVKRTRANYEYLVAAYNKGVIKGVTAEKFDPEGNLTREQAAAIIVRALGLEGKAPDPGYSTSYKDDNKISNYARDGVYVVTQLVIMNGSGGNFMPHDTLTRAQAAAIIERFLQYLENDLKENYRDDILFFEY